MPVTSDMKAPVYVYYELDKYYQNHRRYAIIDVEAARFLMKCCQLQAEYTSSTVLPNRLALCSDDVQH